MRALWSCLSGTKRSASSCVRARSSSEMRVDYILATHLQCRAATATSPGWSRLSHPARRRRRRAYYKRHLPDCSGCGDAGLRRDRAPGRSSFPRSKKEMARSTTPSAPRAPDLGMIGRLDSARPACVCGTDGGLQCSWRTLQPAPKLARCARRRATRVHAARDRPPQGIVRRRRREHRTRPRPRRPAGTKRGCDAERPALAACA